MDWNPATGWWVAAGLLVAAELVSGTFYLLMLAIGAVAGATAAHGGLPVSGQLLVAALVGGGAAAAWHLRRGQRSTGLPAESNRDVNMDIGSRVQVDVWQADGQARVTYRGAGWSARYEGPHPALPGEHVIARIDGSVLVLVRPSP